jgi:ribosomal protein S18 acetylase RimI-like enzyme
MYCCSVACAYIITAARLLFYFYSINSAKYDCQYCRIASPICSVDVPIQIVFGDVDQAFENGVVPGLKPAPKLSSPTTIRTCHRDDLAKIAEIHKTQFAVPGTLLAELSPALVAALYETFIDRSVFLVHVTGSRVHGFVLGGAARELMRCRFMFARRYGLRCILDILRRPRMWLLSIRSLAKLIGKLARSKTAASTNEDLRLLSVAVASDAVRKGVGTELVRRFEEKIAGLCNDYRLGVLKSNVAAISFYEKLDFRCVGETATAWTLSKTVAAPPVNRQG